MANRDDEFEPQVGRIGAGDTDLRSHYLRDINRDVARAGRCHSASTSRDRYDAFRTRRVVIKTRLIKLAGRGLKRCPPISAISSGVTREGLPGDPYDATNDRADGASFLNRCDGDRHQFRFIVSPDYAIDYPDLKDFTRRLMRQTEHDLDTKLDWIAVDQYNSGHPHGHIVLSGKDDRGKDLVIARDYLSQGMRDRAAEIVTLGLGPRTDLQVEMRLRTRWNRSVSPVWIAAAVRARRRRHRPFGHHHWRRLPPDAPGRRLQKLRCRILMMSTRSAIQRSTGSRSPARRHCNSAIPSARPRRRRAVAREA